MHILTRPGDNRAWFQQCLESLKNEPINLFIEPGIEGNIALARRHAYNKGNAPYVSYVDPDDWIVPGIYQKLLNEIQKPDNQHLVGVFSKSSYANHLGMVTKEPILEDYTWTLRHHIYSAPVLVGQVFVVKRSAMQQVLNNYFDLLPPVWGQDRGMTLLCSMFGDWKNVPDVGYRWRIHTKNTSQTHKYGATLQERLAPVIKHLEKHTGKTLSPT